MSISNADRWLWLGLGVSLIIAAIGVRRSIQNVLQESSEEDHQDVGIAEQVQPHTQSISLSTLRVLMKSPNVNIQDAATDLIHLRLGELDHYRRVRALVEKDAESDDQELKLRASIALAHLHKNRDFVSRWKDNNLSRPLLSPAETSVSMLDSAWPETLEDMSEVAIDLPPAIPRERPQSQDAETRRRRREAVVLHEGSGEIIESDIFRPGHAQHAHATDD